MTRAIQRQVQRPWTEKEDAWLRDNYHELGANGAAVVLNRTVTAIQNRATKKKIATRPRGGENHWRDDETETLRKYHAQGLPYLQIAQLMNRAPATIERHIDQLNDMPPEYEQVKCLGCQRMFASEDRRRNRLCSPCKRKATDASWF